jgi:DnaJ-class molecular chaperone
MTNLKSNEVSTEVECPGCNGTGFPAVVQAAQAGRRIYPPPCKQCLGKGRVRPA